MTERRHILVLGSITAFTAEDMKINCSPVCKSCDYLSIEGRCPIDPNAPSAWEDEDLDRMFEKLTQEPYFSEYSVEVLSSPATGGPWVVTMDNVVSAEEAERLIELGAGEGYERSTDVGKMKVDGTTERKVSTGRTSTNAWCQHECYEDSAARAVVDRLSNLTGIDEINSEYLQLLKVSTSVINFVCFTILVSGVRFNYSMNLVSTTRFTMVRCSISIEQTYFGSLLHCALTQFTPDYIVHHKER